MSGPHPSLKTAGSSSQISGANLVSTCRTSLSTDSDVIVPCDGSPRLRRQKAIEAKAITV